MTDTPTEPIKKKKLKPYTVGELEHGLREGTFSVAFVNFKVKYAAAAAGIFDFPADAIFFDEINRNGYTKKATKIVLTRLELLREKKGAKHKIFFDGVAQEKAIQTYKAELREWVKLREAKRRKDYDFICQKLGSYIIPNKTQRVGLNGKPVKPRVKKAIRK